MSDNDLFELGRIQENPLDIKILKKSEVNSRELAKLTSTELEIDTPLTVRFFAENAYGDDSGGGGRERIALAVDNIYTSIEVPVTEANPPVSCGDLAGDLNNDGIVNLLDVQILGEEWMDCNWNPSVICTW